MAVLLLGPLLGPGALFFLDMSAVPDPALPRGFFALGPEVPRNTPFDLLMHLASAVVGATTAVKLVMAAAVVTAAVGTYRLLHHHGPVVAGSAGLLFATSPFLTTRLAVGHLSAVVALALLPWVLPALANAGRDMGRAFVALVVLSLTGSFGGIIGVLLVAVTVARSRPRRLPVMAVTAVAACSTWLVPGVIVMLGSPSLVSSSRFPSGTRSLAEAPELLAGHGFWQELYQVGADQPLVGVMGIVLFTLAVAGTRQLHLPVRTALEGGAAVAILLSLASTLPGLEQLTDAATATPIGAPFREPQRYLGLYVLWMAASAPLGARRGARALGRNPVEHVVLVLPAAFAVMLASPALWGLAPQVRPVAIPESWEEARAAIRDGDGTTLVLPWSRYLSLRFAGAPRSINPMPKYLGTDVLTSTDLRIGGASTEGIDPRESAAAAITERIAEGDDDVVEELDALGIRWVLLLHEGNYERYVLGLAGLPLSEVLVGTHAALYEVPGGPADGRAADGGDVRVDVRANVVAEPDTDEAFTWFRGHQPGWVRGTEPVERAELGLMRVPAVAGPIRYWPAGLVLLTDAAVVLAVVGVTRRRHDDTDTSDDDIAAQPPPAE